MWVWETFLYLIPAIVITMQILSPGHDYSYKPPRIGHLLYFRDCPRAWAILPHRGPINTKAQFKPNCKADKQLQEKSGGAGRNRTDG
jgi:hypothetical protein